MVHGDVTFGKGVVVRGTAELEAAEPETLAAGSTIGSESGA